METQLALNPYKSEQTAVALHQQSATTDIETQRAIAEIQAQVVMAKRFPRDVVEATDKILNECQRQSLAEQALYSYSRGGSEISGPSIRLAEAIARNWRNLDYGVKELNQANGQSEMLAYAYDLENNVRSSRVFYVRHQRFTKKGTYKLEDSRDIYELTANQAARRLRAAILAVIPGDVVEAAKQQCEATLRTKADTSPEALKRMIAAFGELGVTKEQIEKRIQRRIDTITPAQVISLRKIYNSIKDEMSGVADWFEPEQQSGMVVEGANAAEQLKNAIKSKAKKQATPDVIDEPTEQVSFSPCPGDPLDQMTGDKPTASYCSKCSKRDDCEAWPIPE